MESWDFGWALDQLRDGERVRRRGWNGKGMYLELQVHDEHYIYMKTADDNLVPWLASQTDMLALDWELAL